MEFRDALKFFRAELGITQTELSAAVGIHASTMVRWENGQTLPNRSAYNLLSIYARSRGASETCLNHLKQTYDAATKAKFDKKYGNLCAAEHDSLRQLIDEASYPIYICDLETDALLYLNRRAQAMLDCAPEALSGRECYKCLMHRDTPCAGCNKSELVPERFISCEVYRPADGVTYRVSGKRLQWNGRTAQVRYITESDAGTQLKSIADGINGGVIAVVLDKDGSERLTYANDRYYKLFGYTREQWSAELKSPNDVLLPEDAAYVASMIERVKTTHQSAIFKNRAVKRDKSVITVRCNASVSENESLHGTVLVSVLTDITAVDTIERQALCSSERLQAILANVDSGIAATMIDDDGSVRYAFVSDRYYSMFGYTREQYEAEVPDPFAHVVPESRDEIRREAAALTKVGDSKSLIYQVIRRDGRRMWVHVDVSIMRFADEDRPVQLLVFTDITEKKEAEDKRRISEEMLRVAAESDSRDIVIYDVKSNACRTESRGLFSATLGESIRNIPDSLLERGLVAPETEAECRTMFARLCDGERKLTTSLLLQTDENEYQWFECAATMIFDSENKPDHAVLVFHNITEQRIKEAVYQKWQQSLKSRAPESYTMLRCNLSKDAPLDEQDGTLLRIRYTPEMDSFNARSGKYADEYVYPEDRAGYLALLNSECLLAMYYRGEHAASLEYREMAPGGETAWRLVTVELVQCLNSMDIQAFMMYEDINEKKRTELKKKQLAETDPLTGVYNRAAFFEKVDAAIKAKAGGQHALLMFDMDGFKKLNDTFGHPAGDQALIDISAAIRTVIREGDMACRLGGDEFLVWLCDLPYDAVIRKRAQEICTLAQRTYSENVTLTASMGVAVYPRDGHNIDSLYHNADTALYKVKQSGKNDYAFHSTGTEEAPALVTDISEKKAFFDANAWTKHRMLIVDDNATARNALKNLFKEAFIIETAKNGKDALMCLRHFTASISVVLLKLTMPGMDGFAVLRQMQENIDLRSIPVIAVSEREDHAANLKALKSGAADYVTMPFDADFIRVRVESAINKAENERLRAQNSYLQLERVEELRYRTVLESSGMVVVDYDWCTHIFTYDKIISRHIAGNYGGRNLWAVLLSDMVADSQTVKSLQDMLLSLSNDREKKEDGKLLMLKKPSGDRHWFRVNAYKIADAYGLCERMILTFLDVHDEMLANEQLQAIMQNVNGGITATLYHDDGRTELLFANDSFFALYGYTREQWNDEVKNMPELILPEDREKTMDTVACIVRERISETFEYRCRKRDGSIMWTRAGNTIVSIPSLGDTVLLAITTDTTELHTAQKQASEANEKLNVILNDFNTALSVAVIHGESVRHIFSNSRFWELVGYSEKEYLARFGAGNGPVHPEDKGIIASELASAIRQERDFHADVRVLCANGAYKPCHISGRLILQDAGRYLIYTSYTPIG